MAKIPAFIALFLLAGSSAQIHVQMSPFRTTITVPDEIADQYETSPLTLSQWINRHTLQSVPVFETGTSITQVRNGIVDLNLKVLREWPGYIVVREGVPLIDTSGPVRESYLYGFTNDRLTLGPIRFSEAVSAFKADGLKESHLHVLDMFVAADPKNPSPYNGLAWLLATHPDTALRDGGYAIELAMHALAQAEVADWQYVDTLAAAYAAAGDFRNAVREQRRAIYLQGGLDEGARERLKLYQDGQVYISMPVGQSAANDVGDDSKPKANPELIAQAAAGSRDAQWTLAIFYISNRISESDGVIAPGVFWMQQAAESGHEYAANEIGYCYMMGDCGVELNNSDAVRWFRRALEHSDMDAAFNLGRLLAFAYGEPRNDPEATRLLAAAANSGNNAAAFNVAFRFGEGLGEPPNYAAQRKYLRQIQLAGYEASDYLLDDFYFQRVYGAAAISAVLDRAAVQPHELGVALMDMVKVIEQSYRFHTEVFTVDFGDGLSVEYASEYAPNLVFSLVRISASLGTTEAQLRMAKFYEGSEVTPRNLVEAHYWRERAAQ